jgi:hypothetical protein
VVGEMCNTIIEVKGFSSNWPISFGPKEKWNRLYIVDCQKTMDKIFKIYEIKISNEDDIWENIKINKKQTFKDQCNEKRRPRICFNLLKKQLNANCKLVFDDHLNNLNPDTF